MALTAYNILTANSPENLVAQVTEAAADGWLPLGGPSIHPHDGTYAQAMAKGDIAGAPGTGDVYELPAATEEDLGGVLQGAAVADAADETELLDTVNALLASLRAGGTIASA